MIICIAAVCHTSVWERHGIRVNASFAVVLKSVRALFTIRSMAGGGLGTDTNTVPKFNAPPDFAANTDSFSDDFVTDAAGLRRQLVNW